MTIRTALGYPNTRAERMGVVLITAAAAVFGALMLHWNVTDSLFFYPRTVSWLKKIPQPTSETEGAFWRESSDGWQLFASKCVETERTKVTKDPFIFNLILPQECQVRFVPHERHSQNEWEQSVSGFTRKIFLGGAYSIISVGAAILFWLGALLYIGVVSKIIRWVTDGQREA